MSDYSKSVDFAAKDALISGNPLKVIQGTEIDTEYNNIQTAVNSKYDNADIASQAEAEAGILNTVLMTPLRSQQLIDSYSGTVDINGGNIDGTIIGASSPAAGTFSDLTATTSVSFSGATVSDGGTVTTTNIDGGTIDGTVIGGASPAAGTFTTATVTTADINGGNIDGTVIGATTPAAATFTSVTIDTSLDLTGATVSNGGSVTTVDINGGTADSLVIGGTTAADGNFDTLTSEGPLVIEAEIVETVFAINGTTPTLDPANGTIQTWALTANSTLADGLASGESVQVVLAGTSFSVTSWPATKWIGGSAPDLDATDDTIVEFWKVGTTVYGALVGVAS